VGGKLCAIDKRTNFVAGRAATGNGARRSSSIVPASRDVIELAARRLSVLGIPYDFSCSRSWRTGRARSPISRILDVEHQLVSKHLSELLRCDVVVRRQEGTSRSIPSPMRLR